MAQNAFDVVFYGVVRPGQDREQVKRNVAGLFKTELARIAPLFSGARYVIKRGLDQAAALRYQKALHEAGAVVELVETVPKEEGSVSEVLAVEGLANASVDPPGVTLVAPARVEPPVIDTGHLRLDQPGVVLVEHPEVPEPEMDLDGLSLAPAGEDLIEAKMSPELRLDLDGMSLAEPGVILSEHELEPPPSIDTSKLSLS